MLLLFVEEDQVPEEELALDEDEADEVADGGLVLDEDDGVNEAEPDDEDEAELADGVDAVLDAVEDKPDGAVLLAVDEGAVEDGIHVLLLEAVEDPLVETLLEDPPVDKLLDDPLVDKLLDDPVVDAVLEKLLGDAVLLLLPLPVLLVLPAVPIAVLLAMLDEVLLGVLLPVLLLVPLDGPLLDDEDVFVLVVCVVEVAVVLGPP